MDTSSCGQWWRATNRRRVEAETKGSSFILGDCVKETGGIHANEKPRWPASVCLVLELFLNDEVNLSPNLQEETTWN